jgi:hypothetical protein
VSDKIWRLPLAKRLETIRKQSRIEVFAEQDDIPVRGNAMASGDDELDRKTEDWILRRLDSGDVWAWAAVTVRVTWKGISCEDHLGACSYDDEADFRQEGGGYFGSMVDICVAEIEKTAEAIHLARS